MHDIQTQSMVSCMNLCVTRWEKNPSFPWSMVVCMLGIFMLQDKEKTQLSSLYKSSSSLIMKVECLEEKKVDHCLYLNVLDAQVSDGVHFKKQKI